MQRVGWGGGTAVGSRVRLGNKGGEGLVAVGDGDAAVGGGMDLSTEAPVELALLLNQILYGMLDFNTQVIEALAAIGKGAAERVRGISSSRNLLVDSTVESDGERNE
ncbi:hypothetical protein ACE6H2_002071 [Prunus campanulata]